MPPLSFVDLFPTWYLLHCSICFTNVLQASFIPNGSKSGVVPNGPRIDFFSATNFSTTYPLFFGDWGASDGLIGSSFPRAMQQRYGSTASNETSFQELVSFAVSSTSTTRNGEWNNVFALSLKPGNQSELHIGGISCLTLWVLL
jgi:hypothetical protein